jgi:hypothetical protein
LCLSIAAGCDGHKPTGPHIPSGIPFDLVIPVASLPQGDFYAISGLAIRNQTIQKDTLLETIGQSFYGEFYAKSGIPLPAMVLLNGVQLERNLGTDTLRFTGQPASSVYDVNTWSLADSGETAATFISPVVPILDTIAPFNVNRTVRLDTSLTLRWKPSTLGAGGGMSLIWKAPGGTYGPIALNDFTGSVTLKPTDLKNLAGRDTLIVTRYRIDAAQKFKGKTLVIVRMAQRILEITGGQ